jgi:hypothetical protein
MKEIFVQLGDNYNLIPVSEEYKFELKSFKPNQILRAEIYGTTRQRSVLQNKWIHAIFRMVAENQEDTDWNTPEKVKRNVKMAMRFFKNDVIVHNNKVFFELRSFAFDQMEHQEANLVYEEAKLICAKKLGIDPEILEANAKRNAS